MEFKDGVTGDGLDLGLLEMLTQAETWSGCTFTITSAKRAGSEKNFHDPHRDGLAVDIRCSSGSARWNILKALLRVGFTRIGLYDRHIHVDRSVSAPNYVLWTGVSK